MRQDVCVWSIQLPRANPCLPAMEVNRPCKAETQPVKPIDLLQNVPPTLDSPFCHIRLDRVENRPLEGAVHYAASFDSSNPASTHLFDTPFFALPDSLRNMETFAKCG